ncbi:MAG TPA: EVE domain-containing protein, partial [bacterium]|nr:EVE domain-containing protein [bacterium]
MPRARRQYWLMKSEPSVFGIDDLRKKKTAHWDGVRNYMARNYMMQMKRGDRVFFYHSSEEPVGIAGTAVVAREAYPDHTSWDRKSKYFDRRSTRERPLWFMVDVSFESKFDDVVPLEALRRQRALKKMITLRQGNRLSVTPVTEAEWKAILAMAK